MCSFKETRVSLRPVYCISLIDFVSVPLLSMASFSHLSFSTFGKCEFQSFDATDADFFFPDKSIGDTSDIMSESSGIGTNSDSTITLPGTTVVCVEPYRSNQPGHLSIQQGDILEGKTYPYLSVKLW